MDVIINNPASTPVAPVAPVAAPVVTTGQVYAPAPYAYPAYREEHHFGFGGFFLFPLLFILGAAFFLRWMRRRFMRGARGNWERGNWGRGNWDRGNWDRSNWNSHNGSDSRANSNPPHPEENKGPGNFDKAAPSSGSSRPDMGRPDTGERREWWEAFVGERSGKDRALEIARERFAKGEIRFEEFETIRRGLMGQG